MEVKKELAGLEGKGESAVKSVSYNWHAVITGTDN